MAIDFAGKGGKRPQIEIPIERILLDDQNPRLVQYTGDIKSVTQDDLIEILYENFDTETVALSLSKNGYFDEEPLIVIPNNLPEGITLGNMNYLQALDSLQIILRDYPNVTFTVIEGNRRLSSIKLLIDANIRKKLAIDRYYPVPENDAITEDISNVPCIVYNDRDEISDYLGVRHISGLLKWEAFAKAAYISDTIRKEIAKGKTSVDAIKEVQNTVGDRSDVLKKQYILYKLFQEAKSDIDEFDTKPIVFKFSLLNVMYNSPSIRDYIGVKGYGEVDFENRLVPPDKLGELQQVLTWIYGNTITGERPILTDSRLITSHLSHIVRSPEAVKYLNKYRDIEGAYERTNGEKEFLLKNLSKAFRTIQESLTFAYKFEGDKDILDKVRELEEIVKVLNQNLKKNV